MIRMIDHLLANACIKLWSVSTQNPSSWGKEDIGKYSTFLDFCENAFLKVFSLQYSSPPFDRMWWVSKDIKIYIKYILKLGKRKYWEIFNISRFLQKCIFESFFFQYSSPPLTGCGESQKTSGSWSQHRETRRSEKRQITIGKSKKRQITIKKPDGLKKNKTNYNREIRLSERSWWLILI